MAMVWNSWNGCSLHDECASIVQSRHWMRCDYNHGRSTHTHPKQIHIFTHTHGHIYNKPNKKQLFLNDGMKKPKKKKTTNNQQHNAEQMTNDKSCECCKEWTQWRWRSWVLLCKCSLRILAWGCDTTHDIVSVRLNRFALAKRCHFVFASQINKMSTQYDERVENVFGFGRFGRFGERRKKTLSMYEMRVVVRNRCLPLSQPLTKPFGVVGKNEIAPHTHANPHTHTHNYTQLHTLYLSVFTHTQILVTRRHVFHTHTHLLGFFFRKCCPIIGWQLENSCTGFVFVCICWCVLCQCVGVSVPAENVMFILDENEIAAQ